MYVTRDNSIYDFLLERTLRRLDPQLHKRYQESIFAVQKVLESYSVLFPFYTDHTILHSIDVTNFCNRLIAEQIDKLNADEIYVLLMACYLHDTGMGISQKDYTIFRDRLGLETVPISEVPEQVRVYHNDFSGCFIKKYALLFDIPSDEHLFAIIQVSRGHRKTDLYDEAEYPAEYKLPNGNTVCLPYLAALVRLADEIDIAADRNVSFLYEGIAHPTQESLIAFSMHEAIRHVEIDSDCFVIYVNADEPEVYNFVKNQNIKVQSTIDYCVDVTAKRTNFTINQSKIKLITDKEELKLYM